MINNIIKYHKDKTTRYKVGLTAFSLLFTKSIFISPFSLTDGLPGIILGIILWAAVCCILFAAVYFIGKVSWQYKDTNVKKTKVLLYMVPSLALSIFLLLVYFPGIVSTDSMYIWEITAKNDYSNLHPLTYVFFVRLLRHITDSPWIVISVQFTFSAFVFAYIGYTFETFGLSKKLCWAIVAVLSFYTVNAISNVTMLKDVPYIMSLVLISTIIMKSLVRDKLTILDMVLFSAAGLIAAFSRHNGKFTIPVILIFLFIYYLRTKQKPLIFKAAAMLVCVTILFLSTNAILVSSLGEKYWERDGTSDILILPTAQLSYTVDKNWSDFSKEEQNRAKTYLDMTYINYQKNSFPNWNFNNRYLETMKLENILADKRGYINFYFDTFKKYPLDFIKEYGQLTGIVWATPNYGYTLVRNFGIPEYSANINLESDYKLPKVANYLDSLKPVYFLIRPALWLMLSILMIFALGKGRNLMAIAIASPMFANALGYLITTPAQNVRYLYCNFSCFIIVMTFALMTTKAVNSKKDDTEGGI